MSIWGKLLLGAAGLALGGPLGALVGVMLGHAFLDGGVELLLPRPSQERHQMVFAAAAVALAAKLAKADGCAVETEWQAFRRLFPVAPQELPMVARFFKLAAETTLGFEDYAAQAARLLGRGSPALVDLWSALRAVALADGVLSAPEVRYLKAVADIFGIAASGLAGKERADAQGMDPYAVLGVTRRTPWPQVQARYRALAKELHPDRHLAAGVPPEFIKVAEERMAAVTAAYHVLTQARRAQAAE